MNSDELCTRFVSYLRKKDFSFVPFDGPSDPIIRASPWFRAAASFSACVAFGPLAAFSSGLLPDFQDEQLTRSLQRLYELGVLVAVSLHSGAVRIALVVDAEGLSNEVLVGRCVLLHEKLNEFRAFAMTLVRTRFLEAKQATVAHVFFIFRERYRADAFASQVAGHCKHITFWKKIWTLPWAVDVLGHRIIKWQGFPPYDSIGQTELEACLFGT